MTRFLGSALLALALLAGCSRAEERRVGGEAGEPLQEKNVTQRFAGL